MPINIRTPLFRNSVFVTHCCQLTILLPFVLIPDLSLAGDKWPEYFDSTTMNQESGLHVDINVGPIVGSVMSCNVDEGQSWGKGCPEISGGGSISFYPRKLQVVGMLSLDEFDGKPVRDERANKGAKESGINLSWEWWRRHALAFLVGVVGGAFPGVVIWLGLKFRTPNPM